MQEASFQGQHRILLICILYSSAKLGQARFWNCAFRIRPPLLTISGALCRQSQRLQGKLGLFFISSRPPGYWLSLQRWRSPWSVLPHVHLNTSWPTKLRSTPSSSTSRRGSLFYPIHWGNSSETSRVEPSLSTSPSAHCTPLNSIAAGSKPSLSGCGGCFLFYGANAGQLRDGTSL